MRFDSRELSYSRELSFLSPANDDGCQPINEVDGSQNSINTFCDDDAERLLESGASGMSLDRARSFMLFREPLLAGFLHLLML